MRRRLSAPSAGGRSLPARLASALVAGALSVAGLGGLAPVSAASSLPTAPLASAAHLTTAGLTSGSLAAARATEVTPVAGQVTISVDALSSEVLTGATDLTISGTIANGTEEELTGLDVNVMMQRTTDVTQQALSAWLRGERNGWMSTVDRVDLEGSLAAGATRTFTLTIPADALPLADSSQWGPRGIEVALRSERSEIASHRSIVMWDPGVTVDASRTTVVVPVAASAAELALLTSVAGKSRPTADAAGQPSASPSPSAQASAGAGEAAGEGASAAPESTASASADPAAQKVSTQASSDEITRLDALVTRVTSLLALARDGVVLAVDPALLAILGTDTSTTTSTTTSSAMASSTASPTPSLSPTEASDLATEAAASASESPTAQASQKPSSSSQAALQALATLAPTTSSQRQALSQAFTRAQAGGEVILLPWSDADTSALTRAGRTDLITAAYERTARAATTWSGASTSTTLATAPLDTATLAALPASATTVIASASDMPVAESLTYTPSGYASAGGRTVLLPDLPLSSAMAGTMVSDSVGNTDTVTTPGLSDLDARQLLRAESAILTRQAPNIGRSVIVSVDREAAATADPAVLATRISALLGSSWVKAQSLASLTQEATNAISAGDVAQRAALPESHEVAGEVSGADLTAADTQRAYLTSIGSVLASPAALLGDVDDITLTTAATGWRTDPAARSHYLATVHESATAVISALTVVPSSTINVISSSADLPLRIQSRLGQEATVRIHLTPGSARMQAVRDVTVTVPAHGEITATVPIRAVGSGNVDVRIDLLSSDSTVVGTSLTLHTRVRADWESLGTRIIAGLLAALFAAGIIRTVRRGRRPSPDLEEQPGQAPAKQEGSAPSGEADQPADAAPSPSAESPAPAPSPEAASPEDPAQAPPAQGEDASPGAAPASDISTPGGDSPAPSPASPAHEERP